MNVFFPVSLLCFISQTVITQVSGANIDICCCLLLNMHQYAAQQRPNIKLTLITTNL